MTATTPKSAKRQRSYRSALLSSFRRSKKHQEERDDISPETTTMTTTTSTAITNVDETTKTTQEPATADSGPSLNECVTDMATREKREKVSKSFFPNTGYNYDRCVAYATLGFDAEWKRLLLRQIPTSSKNVLELASGTAIVSKRILKRCGVFTTKLTCVDITDDYVDVAKAKLAALEEKENQKRNKGKKEKEEGKIDVAYVIKNAEDIAEEDLQSRGPFDCVVSSYIPKYVDAEKVISSIEPHLTEGATLVVHDFDVPYAGPCRWIWHAHMDIWAWLGPKMFGKEWAACFEANLKELIIKSDWAKVWSDKLKERGCWSDVKIHRITLGGASLVTAKKN